MPAFEYTAMDGSGREKKGTIAAESEQDVASKLKEMSLFPTMIQLKPGQIPGPPAVTAEGQMTSPPVQESPLAQPEEAPAPPPAQAASPLASAPVSPLASAPPPSAPLVQQQQGASVEAVELGSLPGIMHIPINRGMTLCGEEIENGVSIPFNECSLNCPACRRMYEFCRSMNFSVQDRHNDKDGVNTLVKAVRHALINGMSIERLVQTLEALRDTYSSFLQKPGANIEG